MTLPVVSPVYDELVEYLAQTASPEQILAFKVSEAMQERGCEYCHQPELFSPYSYHVDHILPVKRHGGSEGLDNLAWACFECNTNKAGDISRYDYETKELTPLYNPRTQLWDDHFEMQGANI
jgi:5-methylcytosine-specific restriction endonuclease McrA